MGDPLNTKFHVLESLIVFGLLVYPSLLDKGRKRRQRPNKRRAHHLTKVLSKLLRDVGPVVISPYKAITNPSMATLPFKTSGAHPDGFVDLYSTPNILRRLYVRRYRKCRHQHLIDDAPRTPTFHACFGYVRPFTSSTVNDFPSFIVSNSSFDITSELDIDADGTTW